MVSLEIAKSQDRVQLPAPTPPHTHWGSLQICYTSTPQGCTRRNCSFLRGQVLSSILHSLNGILAAQPHLHPSWRRHWEACSSRLSGYALRNPEKSYFKGQPQEGDELSGQQEHLTAGTVRGVSKGERPGTLHPGIWMATATTLANQFW